MRNRFIASTHRVYPSHTYGSQATALCRKPWSHGMLYGICLLLLVWLVCLSSSMAMAATNPSSAEEIRNAISAEEARVKKEKANLTHLTEQERKLNSNLAKAEKDMSKLELSIATQEKELDALEAKVASVRTSLEKLESQRGASERDLETLISALWPLASLHSEDHKQSLSTDTWHEMERDYIWTQELYTLIAEQRNDVSAKEADITATLKQHEALVEKRRAQMTNINKNREKLLKDRLDFRQKLATVRAKKKSTAEELNDVLAIIQKFNVRLEQMEGRDITKLKGYLPWPVAGKQIHQWSPNANPPIRGIGFAANKGTKVKSVAWGKVAHNDILRGLGRVVVLMHDKNYYTLYAFLEDSPLKVGDTVTSGADIGTAGFYPEADGTGLYFELRLHQKAINPKDWLRRSG